MSTAGVPVAAGAVAGEGDGLWACYKDMAPEGEARGGGRRHVHEPRGRAPRVPGPRAPPAALQGHHQERRLQVGAGVHLPDTIVSSRSGPGCTCQIVDPWENERDSCGRACTWKGISTVLQMGGLGLGSYAS